MFNMALCLHFQYTLFASYYYVFFVFR